MADVLRGWGQRQPCKTGGSRWDEPVGRCSTLVHGETTLASAVLPPSFTPVRPWCIFSPSDTPARAEAGVQAFIAHPAEQRGFFQFPTGANWSSSRRGTSLVNSPPSAFRATALTSASIWGCWFLAGKGWVWRTRWSREILLEKCSYHGAGDPLQKPTSLEGSASPGAPG